MLARQVSGARSARSDVSALRDPSTHSTSARSGGAMWRPTTSRTLATKSGSVESSNVSRRCGCKPKARHTRCTVETDRPLARAMPREPNAFRWRADSPACERSPLRCGRRRSRAGHPDAALHADLPGDRRRSGATTCAPCRRAIRAVPRSPGSCRPRWRPARCEPAPPIPAPTGQGREFRLPPRSRSALANADCPSVPRKEGESDTRKGVVQACQPNFRCGTLGRVPVEPGAEPAA